ncbi:MAG: SDR family oxidoreductase [Elainella sp.]
MIERVLVTGATGGVGQITVAKLLEKGYQVRVLTRSAAKGEQMFAKQVEVSLGDLLDPATLPVAMTDIDALICCTGTTAFPSEKWQFQFESDASSPQRLLEWAGLLFNGDERQRKARNGPQQVDAEGVKALVAAAPRSLNRFVFVSSCGVQRKTQFPYSVLNAYGVLDAKQQGEQAIISSGLPYTIIRPGRLIDGPFTSYDLNTLLKASTDGKQGVVLGTGDTLNGQTSRIDVAAACVECLSAPSAVNKTFELINQGSRPVDLDWAALFAGLA